MRVLLPIICSGQARRADGSNSPTALKPRTRRSRPPAPRGRPPPRSDPHFNPIRAHSSCKDRGGGSCCPRRQGISGGRDSLVGPRDPPPLPAPTRGGGCANVTDSIQMQQALVAELFAQDALIERMTRIVQEDQGRRLVHRHLDLNDTTDLEMVGRRRDRAFVSLQHFYGDLL